LSSDAVAVVLMEGFERLLEKNVVVEKLHVEAIFLPEQTRRG
jgi:hypothetical protein